MRYYYATFITLFTVLVLSEGRISDKEPSEENECSPQMNTPLKEVAEKICELCHEFHSHEVPNMRAECRSECFSTDKFRTCMRMFTNAPKRHNRHSRQHFWKF
ncbi:Crustacean CHH/MIH/GIH neurohormone family protein [Trichostrongylus colubriformis]|uniref:Crustacean CHH/MIH/GIH neurohormone family protein n=1 Tax=Trichostrongylus colubriformis TaxID=6319 RepID=A0AAN8IMZ0_TRICO